MRELGVRVWRCRRACNAVSRQTVLDSRWWRIDSDQCFETTRNRRAESYAVLLMTGMTDLVVLSSLIPARHGARQQSTSGLHAPTLNTAALFSHASKEEEIFRPSGAIPVSWEKKHVSSRIDAEGVKEAPSQVRSPVLAEANVKVLTGFRYLPTATYPSRHA